MALDVATTANEAPQALRSAYAGMALIPRSVIVPLAVGSLITGLVISLGTKWGVFRHYWVVMSLVLTSIATAVLFVEMQTITHRAHTAADPSTSSRGTAGTGQHTASFNRGHACVARRPSAQRVQAQGHNPVRVAQRTRTARLEGGANGIATIPCRRGGLRARPSVCSHCTHSRG